MVFPYSDHFSLESPSPGDKISTTHLDVLTSTNLTRMLSRTTTAMAIQMPAFPLMLECTTQAQWCSKAQ